MSALTSSSPAHPHPHPHPRPRPHPHRAAGSGFGPLWPYQPLAAVPDVDGGLTRLARRQQPRLGTRRARRADGEPIPTGVPAGASTWRGDRCRVPIALVPHSPAGCLWTPPGSFALGRPERSPLTRHDPFVTGVPHGAGRQGRGPERHVPRPIPARPPPARGRRPRRAPRHRIPTLVACSRPSHAALLFYPATCPPPHAAPHCADCCGQGARATALDEHELGRALQAAVRSYDRWVLKDLLWPPTHSSLSAPRTGGAGSPGGWGDGEAPTPRRLASWASSFSFQSAGERGLTC